MANRLAVLFIYLLVAQVADDSNTVVVDALLLVRRSSSRRQVNPVFRNGKTSLQVLSHSELYASINGEENEPGSIDGNREDSDDYDDAFWNEIRRQYSTTMPQEPASLEIPQPPKPPSKSDVYNDQELQDLLQLHQNMQQRKQSQAMPDAEQPLAPGLSSSLHDLVQQAVNGGSDEYITPKPISRPTIPQDVQIKVPKIRAIAADVDGTLMTSQHGIHPKTLDAVLQAMESDKVQLFLATGKSRKGALDSLVNAAAATNQEAIMSQRLSSIPGVYIQGLYCVDGKGKVVFEQKLDTAAIRVAEQVAFDANMAIVGYDGNQLFTTDKGNNDFLQEEVTRYGEPPPFVLPLPSLVDYERGFHKLLLIDADLQRLAQVRAHLETVADQYHATITQAVPTMVEVLPAGCSKARGIQELCRVLGIDVGTELLAIGDGENDIDMLKMAAIGAAMGNAVPLAKQAANLVMDSTNNDGAAGDAIHWFGLGGAMNE